MSDQSSLFSQTTCEDFPNAISSPALESGLIPCVSQDGPTIAKSGRSPAHASRSARQGKRKGSRIDDTFSQSSFVSSKDEDLSFALANRYRLQTASLGSTLFDLTWKARRTPSGQLIYAQRARARRTSETVLSSWPTPQAHNVTTRGNTESDHHHLTHDLSNAAVLAAWPTPCVPNGGRVSSNKKDMNKHADGTKAQIGLENAVRLSGWPTPAANEYEQMDEAALRARQAACKEKSVNGNGFGLTLGNVSHLAAWATPTVRDHKDGESEGSALVNALLGRQAWLAGWKTPTAGCDGKGGAQDPQKRIQGGHAVDLQDQVMLSAHPVQSMASGVTQVGYYADQSGVMEIPVGGPLNPGHSRWLQGLPAVWECCAVSAMESLRQLRRNSSKRTSKKGATAVATPQAETDCRMRVSD